MGRRGALLRLALVPLMAASASNYRIPDHLVNASFVPCGTSRSGSGAPECGAGDEGGLFEGDAYGHCVKLAQTPFHPNASLPEMDGACMCLWHTAHTNADDPGCAYETDPAKYFSPECILPKSKCTTVDFTQWGVSFVTCGFAAATHLFQFVVGLRGVLSRSKGELQKSTGMALIFLVASAFFGFLWSICYVVGPWSVYFADFVISYCVVLTGLTYAMGTLSVTLKWIEVGSNTTMSKQGANINNRSRRVVFFLELIILLLVGAPFVMGLVQLAAAASLFFMLCLTGALVLGAFKLMGLLKELANHGAKQSSVNKKASEPTKKQAALAAQIKKVVTVVRLNIAGNASYFVFTVLYLMFATSSLGPKTSSRTMAIAIVSGIQIGLSVSIRAGMNYSLSFKSAKEKLRSKAVRAEDTRMATSSVAGSSVAEIQSSEGSSLGTSVYNSSQASQSSSAGTSGNSSFPSSTTGGGGTSSGGSSKMSTTGTSSGGRSSQ